jgi:2'-hydroxyisoflavone reductase
MRTLILGGTVFLGRAITDAALAAGFDVTHFNRGRSGAEDARVTTVHGDRTRDEDLARLRDRWDVVFDTSGYLPQAVARSVAAFRDAGRYVFVSSISAYAGPDFSEAGALLPVPDPLPDAMTPETYGGLKAGCEAVVAKAFGERATLVRPGLIVGPNDPTDRFTYWPVRVARGGRIAAPGRPGRAVQFIDVRDLGTRIVKLAAGGASGTFNATGPGGRLTMTAFLDACREATGSDARFEWIADEALASHGVAPWKEMPLFVPEAEPHAEAFMAIPIDRALATGLAFRPLGETILDTLAWSRTRPADREWKAGLPDDKERALLG